MRQIYSNAIKLVLKRINSCGQAFARVSDEYTMKYWEIEFHKAEYLKMRIEKRLKADHNVIRVDFVSKKKVA